MTNLSGGRIRVSLEVSDTPELWQWVLSFGHDAEVISPESLREKLGQLAEKTAERYRTSA